MFLLKSKFFRFYSSVPNLMKKYEIVPDVLSEAPPHLAEVKFPSGVTATLGNALTPTEVKYPPCVKWTWKKGALYCVAMIDPDAPSRQRPKYREWLHWLVCNIPQNKINRGTVMAEYIGAGPPKYSGYHRYLVLVYLQKNPIDFRVSPLSDKTADKRPNFSIAKFAQKYKLCQHPVAGNFFRAEFDDYVPILYEQLTAKEPNK